ncbi:hypothetical protein ACR42D_05250 [Desulfovibrio caledoniensis]
MKLSELSKTQQAEILEAIKNDERIVGDVDVAAVDVKKNDEKNKIIVKYKEFYLEFPSVHFSQQTKDTLAVVFVTAFIVLSAVIVGSALSTSPTISNLKK